MGLVPTAEIRSASFFDVKAADLPGITAVVGNPPYVRDHGFTGEARKAGLARSWEQGVKLTQLASSWAHFVIHATSFLDGRDGRLALVLPAELLHADYAEPVRSFLSRRFSSVIVIAFDRVVFEDAQVDAVLLLASNDDEAGMRLVRLHDASELAVVDLRAPDQWVRRGASDRWSSALDEDFERVYANLVASGQAVRLSTLASVDIGVVTGKNEFFILDRESATRLGLPAAALTPIVSRPGSIPGLEVRPDETDLLLDLRGRSVPIEGALKRCLEEGEASGASAGYKTRTRRPWYGVPLPKVRPVSVRRCVGPTLEENLDSSHPSSTRTVGRLYRGYWAAPSASGPLDLHPDLHPGR